MSEEEATKPRRRRLGRRRSTGAEEQADPRGPRLMLIAGGSVIVLVAAGTLVPRAGGQEVPPPVAQPVESSTVICPEPGAVDNAVTRSSMAVVADLEGQDREGSASITYLKSVDDTASQGVPPPDATLAKPGDSARVIADARRLPPLDISTTGSLAPGLVAAQSTVKLYDQDRGLATTACLGPDTSWWFVGGGSTAGRDTSLVLVNPESTPAELEVTIAGPDGPVSTPGLRGIVVNPGARTVIRLSQEAPRLSAAAWHVDVRAGRVVAAVFDSEMAGYVPRGADWVPASADPSTRVLVPGIIPGPGNRQLIIHAPGSSGATVQVRLITRKGSYVPSALSQVDVPAGGVVAVDVDKATDGQAATLDLRSDVPIVAGVRQWHPGIDAVKDATEEQSYAASAVTVTDVAAASGLPAVRSTGVIVWLTSAVMTNLDDTTAVTADDSVTATINLMPDVGSAPAPITVNVPINRVVQVRLPGPPRATWFTAVVRVSGPVVVAHESIVRNSAGSLISGFPWRPLRTTVAVPSAQVDAGIELPPAG